MLRERSRSLSISWLAGGASDLPTCCAAFASWADPAALIVVVDGNGSSTAPTDPKNRLELLLHAARDAEARFQQAGRRVRVLVGVAYPAVEAWWLGPNDPELSEQAWLQRGRPGGATYSKADLKRRLYESEFAPLELMARRQAEAAVFAAAHVGSLTRRFPYGLGSFVQGLQSLKSVLEEEPAGYGTS